jgi:hypothetical protein
LSVASLIFAALSVPALASAAEEPSRRTEIAADPVEIDGHFTFGPENVYGETGFGAGLRLGVPLVTCSAPSDFGILPTVAIGARGHVSEDVAITARIGYPTMTLGLSFM